MGTDESIPRTSVAMQGKALLQKLMSSGDGASLTLGTEALDVVTWLVEGGWAEVAGDGEAGVVIQLRRQDGGPPPRPKLLV
jgi:hypothetical protein